MQFKIFTHEEASLCPDLMNEMNKVQDRYERLEARYQVLQERIR
jgi:hypothetical protein